MQASPSVRLSHLRFLPLLRKSTSGPQTLSCPVQRHHILISGDAVVSVTLACLAPVLGLGDHTQTRQSPESRAGPTKQGARQKLKIIDHWRGRLTQHTHAHTHTEQHRETKNEHDMIFILKDLMLYWGDRPYRQNKTCGRRLLLDSLELPVYCRF